MFIYYSLFIESFSDLYKDSCDLLKVDLFDSLERSE